MDYRKRTKTLTKTIKRGYKNFPVKIEYICNSFTDIWQKSDS